MDTSVQGMRSRRSSIRLFLIVFVTLFPLISALLAVIGIGTSAVVDVKNSKDLFPLDYTLRIFTDINGTNTTFPNHKVLEEFINIYRSKSNITI